MSEESIFSAANLVAVVGWLALACAALVAPTRLWALRLAGIAIPGLLAVAYLALVALGRAAFEAGGFSSIAAVRVLFANDAMLTAGWLHYLAFDLFIGAWIVREAGSADIPGWLVLPHLMLTFLFGPIGLLLFFVTRPFFGHRTAARRS